MRIAFVATLVPGALTLLPALLSMWGDGINRLRIPYIGRNVGRSEASEGRFWHGIVTAVLRHPALAIHPSTSRSRPSLRNWATWRRRVNTSNARWLALSRAARNCWPRTSSWHLEN